MPFAWLSGMARCDTNQDGSKTMTVEIKNAMFQDDQALVFVANEYYHEINEGVEKAKAAHEAAKSLELHKIPALSYDVQDQCSVHFTLVYADGTTRKDSVTFRLVDSYEGDEYDWADSFSDSVEYMLDSSNRGERAVLVSAVAGSVEIYCNR
jgi:hypothetical protein